MRASLSLSLGRGAPAFEFQGQGEVGKVIAFVCFGGCHQVWSILGLGLAFPGGCGKGGGRTGVFSGSGCSQLSRAC